MKGAVTILLVAAFTLSITSCRDKDKGKEEEPVPSQIEITIDPVYDMQFLTSEDVVFRTEDGYDVKLREMKIILTDIRNGNNVLADAALYDSKKGKTLMKAEGTSANFGSLNFNIGVHQDINHSDPAAFSNNHPLNIVNASDMHWSWNPGYIFFKIEMVADTTNDGTENFNHMISYHVGMDDAFQQKQLTDLNWEKVGNNLELLRLKLDIKKLLKNGTSKIDIKTESVTHSGPDQLPLSIKLSENFKEAFEGF